LDELALITRPGALSRRAETGSVAAALGRYRTVEAMQDPAVADGGDVLCVGKSIFTGISRRTNEAAVRKLQESTAAFRYTVKSVAVRDCLHLKSAVTRVAEDTLLLNPHWVDAGAFRGFRCLEVDPREPQAANALLVGRTVLYPLAFPATRRRLEDQGIEVFPVNVSELAKAEGGVTCCSLIFSIPDPS
jgi:dimethylargininase